MTERIQDNTSDQAGDPCPSPCGLWPPAGRLDMVVSLVPPTFLPALKPVPNSPRIFSTSQRPPTASRLDPGTTFPFVSILRCPGPEAGTPHAAGPASATRRYCSAVNSAVGCSPTRAPGGPVEGAMTRFVMGCPGAISTTSSGWSMSSIKEGKIRRSRMLDRLVATGHRADGDSTVDWLAC